MSVGYGTLQIIEDPPQRTSKGETPFPKGARNPTAEVGFSLLFSSSSPLFSRQNESDLCDPITFCCVPLRVAPGTRRNQPSWSSLFAKRLNQWIMIVRAEHGETATATT